MDQAPALPSARVARTRQNRSPDVVSAAETWDAVTVRVSTTVVNVLDGSASTIWHSRWSGTAAPLPHSITIDMHATRAVSGLSYLPRSGSANGRIGRYEVHARIGKLCGEQDAGTGDHSAGDP